MTGSCIREEGGVSCWHMQRHIHTLSQFSISQRLTVRPHKSSQQWKLPCVTTKKELPSSLIKFLYWADLDTHTYDVCLYSCQWYEGKTGSAAMCCLICVCICPLFFCLLLVPWNLTGAMIFIHFILFVCSLSLCMCVCQLLYRPAAYSDHSRPRYAQTGDGEGIQ